MGSYRVAVIEVIKSIIIPSCDQKSKVIIYCYAYQIPLNPPLEKGDLGLLVFEPPFFKGGQGGFVFSWFGHGHDLFVLPVTPDNYLYDGNLV
jgi:hypothetical protein